MVPDRVDIVRRHPDGTTTEQPVEGCSVAPVDAPSAERVREFSESIGVRMAPWQVECVRTLLQGGQIVSPRRFGNWTVFHVVEEFRRAAADQCRQDITEAFDVDPAVVGVPGVRIASDPAVPPGVIAVATAEGGWTPVAVGVGDAAPTRPESDVLAAIDQLERDEIDDLVDMQMRQERSGWDHSINQPRCIHCRGEAHSVPLTARMRQMRALFRSTVEYGEGRAPRASDEVLAQLDAYRYDEDDSEIVCPGSEFVGPPRSSSGLSLADINAEFFNHLTEQWRQMVEAFTQLLTATNPDLTIRAPHWRPASTASSDLADWADAVHAEAAVGAAHEMPEDPPQSRRERRGRITRPLPMWVPRFDGRTRRGRRT